MERKNKIARKVEAGIETNKLCSILKSLDFFKRFFCFLFYAKNFLRCSGIGRVAG